MIKIKLFVSLLYLLTPVLGVSQSTEDIQSKIVKYLNIFKKSELDRNDSVEVFLIEFSANNKRKITQSRIFWVNNGVVKVQNSNFFNRLNFDSLYLVTNTDKSSIKVRRALFTQIIKNVKLVKNPKSDPLLSAVDFEYTYKILQSLSSQKKSHLLKPSIVFQLPIDY